MRCVSYTRTVPWREGTEPAGILEQNKQIADYLKGKPGWTLTKKYSDRKNDPDVSGGFDQMIADGTGRQYDCIVVASLYYCGTSFPMVRQMVYETLYAAGIQFAVASEHFDSTEKTQQEVADYFEAKRREMHRDIFVGWKRSRGEGFVLTSSVPYGYVRPNGCDHLIKDGSVSGILEEIFRKKLQGISNREIAQWLNEQDADIPLMHRNRLLGKPLPDKNGWCANKVTHLVRKRVYTGVLVDKDGNITASGCHEPYLTEEEFDSFPENKRQDRSKLKNRENYRRPSPLATTIYCAHCGAVMHRRSDFETGRCWFVCSRNCQHATAAHPIQVSADEAYQETLAWMHQEQELAKKADRYFRDRDFRSARLRRREQLSHTMQEILAEMELEQFCRVPLYEQYQRGMVSAEEYEERCEIFRHACAELDQKLAVVMQDAKNLEIGFSIKNPWITLYSQTDIPEQLDRYVVHKLVRRVEVSLPTSPEGSAAFRFFPKLAEWKDMILEVLEEG